MAAKIPRISRNCFLPFVGVAIAASAALALTGCTPSSSGGSSGDSDTITAWHYFSDENEVKVMTDYKELFEKNDDGVTVDNVFVPYDQMNSKLISAVGSKTGPDVVVFNGAETSTLALGGALAPMTEQWESFGEKDEFPESVRSLARGRGLRGPGIRQPPRALVQPGHPR